MAYMLKDYFDCQYYLKNNTKITVSIKVGSFMKDLQLDGFNSLNSNYNYYLTDHVTPGDYLLHIYLVSTLQWVHKR